MHKKPSKDKGEPPSEHLIDYLKSSYAERLNWLEKANKFVRALKSKKKAKIEF